MDDEAMKAPTEYAKAVRRYVVNVERMRYDGETLIGIQVSSDGGNGPWIGINEHPQRDEILMAFGCEHMGDEPEPDRWHDGIHDVVLTYEITHRGGALAALVSDEKETNG